MTSSEKSFPIEPIRQAYTALKTKAWHFRIHPYFTKQPSNVVGEYIKHFCPKGGLVLDPFCGSGVTAIEALTNNRKTACLDIDPLATFITRQSCISPVNLDAFSENVERISNSIKSVVEFVRSANEKELDDFEIDAWYPRNIRLPSNADRIYVEDLFYRDNLIILSYILKEIEKTEAEDIKNLLLFAFSGILHRASLTYIEWEGSGGHSTIFQQYRYYVPKKPGKLDVWNLFKRKCNSLKKIKKTCNELLGDKFKEGDSFIIHCDSADNLSKYLDNNSIDYIFTDPPYGDNISYIDLSTMYHAWLGFEINEDMRKREAIEGGELKFDEHHYLTILEKSFEQMFYVLKENAWLSLVFMHSKTNLWYSIRDIMKYIGFKYVNTVVQPLSWSSWHKKTNPLRVLGESLIVNFQKNPKRTFSVLMSLPLVNIIKNVAERVIYREGGATTEEILREVIPDLFENDMFMDASSKKIGDIVSILESDFDIDNNNLWQIRSERKIGNFIPPKLRIKYYVIGYLRKNQKVSFDDIVTTILPLLINGHKPTREDIADVLNEIAKSTNGHTWELLDPSETPVQTFLPFSYVSEEASADVEIPESTIHNQHIYRLAVICRKLGYIPYIGKNERNDPMFASLKPLTNINIEAEDIDRKRIEQIDLIWLNSEAKPVWAFEVEEHSSILSALERFTSILKAEPQLGQKRLLSIIAPRSRRRKLLQELSSSSYIGHPLYIENKITYLFSDDLEKFFLRFRSKKVIHQSDLIGICKIPEKQEK